MSLVVKSLRSWRDSNPNTHLYRVYALPAERQDHAIEYSDRSNGYPPKLSSLCSVHHTEILAVYVTIALLIQATRDLWQCGQSQSKVVKVKEATKWADTVSYGKCFS